MHEYKPSEKLDTRRIQGYDISLKYLEKQDSIIPSWSGNVYYSQYGLEIYLSSTYAKYLLIYYIPTSMFTLTSWVSFIIPPSSYPARLFKHYSIMTITNHIVYFRTTLLVTVFLCQIGIFTAALRDTPNSDKGIPCSEISWLHSLKYLCCRNDRFGSLVFCKHCLHFWVPGQLHCHTLEIWVVQIQICYGGNQFWSQKRVFAGIFPISDCSSCFCCF